MPEKMGYSPKPETEVEKTQKPATGNLADANPTKVESEAAWHGVGQRVGGHGQGGEGH